MSGFAAVPMLSRHSNVEQFLSDFQDVRNVYRYNGPEGQRKAALRMSILQEMLALVREESAADDAFVEELSGAMRGVYAAQTQASSASAEGTVAPGESVVAPSATAVPAGSLWLPTNHGAAAGVDCSPKSGCKLEKPPEAMNESPGPARRPHLSSCRSKGKRPRSVAAPIVDDQSSSSAGSRKTAEKKGKQKKKMASGQAPQRASPLRAERNGKVRPSKSCVICRAANGTATLKCKTCREEYGYHEGCLDERFWPMGSESSWICPGCKTTGKRRITITSYKDILSSSESESEENDGAASYDSCEMEHDDNWIASEVHRYEACSRARGSPTMEEDLQSHRQNLQLPLVRPRWSQHQGARRLTDASSESMSLPAKRPKKTMEDTSEAHKDKRPRSVDAPIVDDQTSSSAGSRKTAEKKGKQKKKMASGQAPQRTSPLQAERNEKVRPSKPCVICGFANGAATLKCKTCREDYGYHERCLDERFWPMRCQASWICPGCKTTEKRRSTVTSYKDQSCSESESEEITCSESESEEITCSESESEEITKPTTGQGRSTRVTSYKDNSTCSSESESEENDGTDINDSYAIEHNGNRIASEAHRYEASSRARRSPSWEEDLQSHRQQVRRPLKRPSWSQHQGIRGLTDARSESKSLPAKRPKKTMEDTSEAHKIEDLASIIDTVLSNDFAVPFRRAVDIYKFTDYHLFVSEPMDFGLIQWLIKSEALRSVARILRKVELVFLNCELYNERHSECYGNGQKLEKEFGKLLRERLPQVHHMYEYQLQEQEQ